MGNCGCRREQGDRSAMRLADSAQDTGMPGMRWLRKIRLPVVGVGMANGHIAEWTQAGYERTQRHRGNHDDLAPCGEPCDGEPDHGLHHSRHSA